MLPNGNPYLSEIDFTLNQLCLSSLPLKAYIDDTSRLVVAYGMFGEETADNALHVLKRAIAKYGPPKEILTDYRP